jgi:Protein of unknown function (DUF3991)/Toprim-like
MERKDLEDLRDKVSCGTVLETEGWKIDRQESTKRAVKYRRGEGEIVIVTHSGKGWFDPMSEAKGDVFGLSEHLKGCSFVEALERVGELVGFVPSQSVWRKPFREKNISSVTTRWNTRLRVKPGSATWRYLNEVRCIPRDILYRAIAHDCIREGPFGSLWAAHKDHTGLVTGWEERGPQWRGFATGGSKRLFHFGAANPRRLCVTEAAIDALSLAGIEANCPTSFSETLYVSTGGGWSPNTDALLCHYAQTPGLLFVAATDRNRQGETYAGRLRLIALDAGCRFSRLMPEHEDWNEDLKALPQGLGKAKNGGGEIEGIKPGCRGPKAHIKGEASPASAALDPSFETRPLM